MRYLGPGILLAGAAIGGSHLVASTQAGAHYGWSLLGILFLVNLFKYPFFRYGQRYTAATGESILQGYMRLGRPYLVLFFILNLVAGIANMAGVSMITGSLATNLGIDGISIPTWSALFMASSVLVIIFGGFGLLRRIGKVVVAVLGLSTIVAMVISLVNGPVAEPGYVGESPWTTASFGFVIMFMGWMPAPIESSVWPSLWMKSQEKLRKQAAVMRETMIDFHVGYYASVILAFVFLVLGKMVMFGSGTELSAQGTVFARQLIDLYSDTIGHWARPLIILAALSAMVSTTLTTIDAYPRSLTHTTTLLFDPLLAHYRKVQYFWLLSGITGAYLLIRFFVDQLGDMLTVAMTTSFLSSPLFAYINYRVMALDVVPDQYRPKAWERFLSLTGIAFLTGFGIIFVYHVFF